MVSDIRPIEYTQHHVSSRSLASGDMLNTLDLSLMMKAQAEYTLDGRYACMHGFSFQSPLAYHLLVYSVIISSLSSFRINYALFEDSHSADAGPLSIACKYYQSECSHDDKLAAGRAIMVHDVHSCTAAVCKGGNSAHSANEIQINDA